VARSRDAEPVNPDTDQDPHLLPVRLSPVSAPSAAPRPAELAICSCISRPRDRGNQPYLGEASKDTVDLYSAASHWQAAKTYAGLAAGTHTITIKVLGTKNAAATSTKVSIDAFIVHS
jgi:hypothetical protein